MANLLTVSDLGAALAGLSALSTASFGLLDASKGVGGGVSNIGADKIRSALAPFAPALSNALGADNWWPVIRTNWIAGVPKADQKAKAQAIVKLGLSSDNAEQVASAAHVDPTALKAAIQRIEAGAGVTGTPSANLGLTDADLNVLGRMNAAIDAVLDAAFEAADQAYRNGCRLLAGVVALALAVGAWALWPAATATPQPSLWAAIAVGLVAVPIAPVAKDLTSALSTAAQTLKIASRA